MPIQFPINTGEKEDHPERLLKLAGVNPKYFYTADELKLYENAINYLATLNDEQLAQLISLLGVDTDTFLYAGDAIPLGGMQTYVYAQKYKIDGDLRENLLSDTVTSAVVDPANPTFKRYDVFIVQDNGEGNPDTIEILSSEESENPIKPVPNLNYQLEISFARFSAGATEPDDYDANVVYKEHLPEEATITSDNGSVDPDSELLPISGSKSILCSTPPHETDTYFDLDTPEFTSDNKLLVFDLNLEETWPFLNRNRHTLDFYLWNEGRRFTGRVRVGSDFGFGFDGAVVNQVQKIAIRLSRFSGWSNKNTFDRIQMRHQRLNTKTYRIDNFEIVNSVETTVLNSILRTSQIPVNDGSNIEDSKVYLEADVDAAPTGSRPTKQADGSLVFETPAEVDLTGKEDKINKGAASGYAPLDATTKLAAAYLNIVNDLITGGVDKLLSAQQGVVLKSQIDAINTLLTSNDVNLDTVQEIVDAIKAIQDSFDVILVNDLTTGGTLKALTAEMGKTLKGLIDSLTSVVALNTAKTTNKEAQTGTGTVFVLTNQEGILSNMGAANSTETYTTTGTVLNAYDRKLINAASEPVITGATKIKGHDFIADTDMYMTAWYNGNRVEFWFEEI